MQLRSFCHEAKCGALFCLSTFFAVCLIFSSNLEAKEPNAEANVMD